MGGGKNNPNQLIFIDGGAHAGVFSDVALACGGICYAFEPNKYLYPFLKEKYENNENLILFNKAISNKNDKIIFYNADDMLVSQGASICKTDFLKQYNGYEVEMIDFCEFLNEVLEKHKKIDFIKLDIEGAEFDVLDSMIEQGLYKNIDFIMVETHERFFDNPKAKINELREKIKNNNITNIYLDWI